MSKNIKSKIISIALISLISLNAIYNGIMNYEIPVNAQSISDLEEVKRENSKKISQLQEAVQAANAKLNKSEKDENAKLEYKFALDEKMKLQNQNIDLVMQQMNSLEESIHLSEEEIAKIENDIILKKEDISEGMQVFKKRLKASYMSGNDGFASIIVGTSDFAEILSKMELVGRVAKHDKELIEKLNTQLNELDVLNEELNSKLATLNQQLIDTKEKKDEFRTLLDELSSDYQRTQQEINVIKQEQNNIEIAIKDNVSQIAGTQEEQELIDSKISAIQEEMRKEAERKAAEEAARIAAEEATRKAAAEEAARKAQEEAARIAAEEASKKAQQEAANNTQNSSQGNVVGEASNSASLSQPNTQTPPVAVTPVVPPAPSKPVVAPTPIVKESTATFLWPVPGYYTVSSGYGYRSFDRSFHAAIDISGGGISGAPIVAVADGVVILGCNTCTHDYSKGYSCGCGGGYGNYLSIVHDSTYATLYGHCQSIIVSDGEKVKKGQTIGYVGSTGFSTGSHLHFEFKKNGVKVNPMDFVS